MVDCRRHRGPHPQDAELFASPRLPALRAAAEDLSWLLTRGYAPPSSLKLVGDRHGLTVRQRVAVARAACSDAARAQRRARCTPLPRLAGRGIHVDGYNLLITLEAALAGGVVLAGRDGTFRDLASMHGSYRTMAETLPALERIGQGMAALGVSRARWLLDAPVSNSGRLRARMLALAAERGWPWEVELAANPDRELIACADLVVSSDSVILDAAAGWVNLARHLVETHVPQAWVVDLCEPGVAGLA